MARRPNPVAFTLCPHVVTTTGTDDRVAASPIRSTRQTAAQCTSAGHQTLLADHYVTVRISSTGNDKAPVESFFALRYPTRQAAQSSIFAYIEGFYNTQRLHSALDYRSPRQFETAFFQNSVAFLPVH